jgi:hypothetical protein
VTRGAPLAPKSHSSKAISFLIRAQSLVWTCREEPHAEHVSWRGRVEASTMPAWPQGQAILSSI